MATQPLPVDKVAITNLDGGTPFRNLQSIDIQSAMEGESPFESTTSTIEYTISGRKVYRPVKKTGA